MDTHVVQAVDGPRQDESGCGADRDRDTESSNDVDLESLFSGDDDMESLFGGHDDTEDTSPASPIPTPTPTPTPTPVPTACPLTLPHPPSEPCGPSLSPSENRGPSIIFPFPLPALPLSPAADAPVDRISFGDVSTTLQHEYDQRVGPVQDGAAATHPQQQQQQEHLHTQIDPSGFDINLGLDIDFDFGLDLGPFTGTDGNSLRAGAVDAEIDFDFRLDAATERQFARELGLELETDTGNTADVEADINACLFDSAGAGTVAASHNGDQQGCGQDGQDSREHLLFGSDPWPLVTAPTTAAGSSACTPLVIDADAASDEVVMLYERPACAQSVPMSASGQATLQRKTAPPALQLLSPASEPLSQPSSRQASEEASPAPTMLSCISAVSSMSSVSSVSSASSASPVSVPAPTVSASLQASIPHYLELRPRCPKTPPPERIDLGTFNVEELLPYVQLHSKLSMVGIQQMLGLDINAGRLVVGECRRYLADPAHRVAPSGTSDAAALRTLKVALIQSSLLLLKYGENGAHDPQSLQNGVGARWFSRGVSLVPQSMHVWPDDSTRLVLLFIQLLYRLTRNNSVRERQRQAAALRKAQNRQPNPNPNQNQNQTPPPTSASPAAAAAQTQARSVSTALVPRAQLKRGPRCSSSEAPVAKQPRLSRGEALPSTTTSTSAAAAAAIVALPHAPRQPILAYNSPCVLRDDLIQSASRRSPAAHSG